MRRTNVSYEEWLDETFGRAVSGDWHPAFVHSNDLPDPVTDELAVEFLTRLFEGSEQALLYFSDRQIAAGLWELGPGDAHCIYNPAIPAEHRERLVGSVAMFFRDFFDKRCLFKLSHLDRDQTEPLNGICYMWWEVITWSWAKDDPNAARIQSKDLDVMEAVLRLSNPACKESALHGLGHMVHYSDRAFEIVERFLSEGEGLSPELQNYARAASSGCIQ